MRRDIEFQFPATTVDAPGEYLNHVRDRLGPQTGKPPYRAWSLTTREFALCGSTYTSRKLPKDWLRCNS